MARKIKVTKVEEESRRETMQRGLKHGSIQNGIDKTLDKFGDPVSEKTVEVLKKIHNGAEVTGPAVDAFVKSAMLFGFAEVFNATSLLGTKIPGLSKIDEEKYEEVAAYLRSYAGQRAGTKTADAAFEVVPVFASMLANPALKDLLNMAEDDVPRLTEGEDLHQDVLKDLEEIGKLSEDD